MNEWIIYLARILRRSFSQGGATMLNRVSVGVMLILGISILASQPILEAADNPKSDDHRNIQQKAEAAPPASQPANEGAVFQALKKLYSVPRAKADRLGPENPPQKFELPRKPPEKLPPELLFEQNRLGLQHYDAIHKSISSVPIGGHDLGEKNPDPPPGNQPENHPPQEYRQNENNPTFYIPPYPQYYYGQGRRRLPRHTQRWTDYRYFGGQPGRYGYGYNDVGPGYAGDFYRFGFMQGFDRGRFEKLATERQETVLLHFSAHLDRALKLLEKGNYHQATDTFKLAAETNQGDPASRLYAAHGLFAIGRYSEAVTYLRRAFQLQPKIAYLNYDIRDDYSKRSDFDKHLADLEKAVDLAPGNIDRLILLGYVRYYTNQRDRAYQPLAQANKINPKDELTKRLLINCQPPDVVLDQIKSRQK